MSKGRQALTSTMQEGGKRELKHTEWMVIFWKEASHSFVWRQRNIINAFGAKFTHEQNHGKLGRECVLALINLDLLFNSISLFLRLRTSVFSIKD